MLSSLFLYQATSRAGSVPSATEGFAPKNTYPPEFAFTPLRSSLAYVPVGGPGDGPLGGLSNNTWPYRNPAAPPAGDAFASYDTPGLAPPPPPEGYIYGAPGGPQGPAFPPPMPGMAYPVDHKLAGEQFASHIQDPMTTLPSAHAGASETKHKRSVSRNASQARNTDLDDDGESSPASSKRAAKDGTRKSVPRPKSGCYTCRIRRKVRHDPN